MRSRSRSAVRGIDQTVDPQAAVMRDRAAEQVAREGGRGRRDHAPRPGKGSAKVAGHSRSTRLPGQLGEGLMPQLDQATGNPTVGVLPIARLEVVDRLQHRGPRPDPPPPRGSTSMSSVGMMSSLAEVRPSSRVRTGRQRTDRAAASISLSAAICPRSARCTRPHGAVGDVRLAEIPAVRCRQLVAEVLEAAPARRPRRCARRGSPAPSRGARRRRRPGVSAPPVISSTVSDSILTMWFLSRPSRHSGSA